MRRGPRSNRLVVGDWRTYPQRSRTFRWRNRLPFGAPSCSASSTSETSGLDASDSRSCSARSTASMWYTRGSWDMLRVLQTIDRPEAGDIRLRHRYAVSADEMPTCDGVAD